MNPYPLNKPPLTALVPSRGIATGIAILEGSARCISPFHVGHVRFGLSADRGGAIFRGGGFELCSLIPIYKGKRVLCISTSRRYRGLCMMEMVKRTLRWPCGDRVFQVGAFCCDCGGGAIFVSQDCVVGFHHGIGRSHLVASAVKGPWVISKVIV